MGQKKRRGAIDRLPPIIREHVDEMIKSNATYSEIAEYIKSSGNSVSVSAIQRYAANLMQSIQALRIAQENFRIINEEIEPYKDIDTTDALLMLSCNKLLERLNEAPDEQIQELDLNELIKATAALTRTIAYKKQMNIKNKSLLENGAELFLSNIYQIMAEENPELYKEVKEFTESKLKSL